ncbi:M3 family oligoendopeptidase [Helicobacter cappadocius]|uniref:M3 family oligoendopeptidase n=1 Tax=Helicobacter cappadocius TaxID=3063998 RepID=A0AA90PRT2_9HELI|nr:MULTISPECIES: M3 family oligoendopeptidase [unclassified Helicobacter]MDO7252859.1 M3 family oligoendopeptidase [Helicobacter sp. faydin-H75]MDP2538902.1 M3 family oligoendopeptidase [Helicobacter sp. faydin-H76]
MSHTLEHKWDLSSLFKSEKDIQDYIPKLKKRAKDYEKKYLNTLESLKATEFQSAITEYESIIEGISGVMTYAFLVFATDTKRGDFYAKYELLANEIEESIVFFEIEFCQLEEKKQKEFIKYSQKYAHYLQGLLDKKAHQLTLAEEKILLNTSPVGVGAFSRLFDEHLASLKIRYEDKVLNEEEILALLHHNDRDIRKKAQKCFSKELQKSSFLLTYILNMVRKDLGIQTKLRSYDKKESFRHIDNQITQKSVDSMIDTVNANFSFVHRYYRVKSKILDLTLRDYDRYAPIMSDGENIQYEEAVQSVLKAFKNFSPKFYEIAKNALKNGWVDSHPKDGKRGGAFSHGCIPSAHPYVLLNFTGNRRDAFTIAHEFGHMIHQELSKKVGYLNMDTPLTTAETASVFAEMLLFDDLKNSLCADELFGIYAGKIEDIFSTLFRQVVMTNFERRIHDIEGELKDKDFDKIWREENEKMFDTSLKLTKNYDRWWSYIPHFIHSPFYCYSYSYGQLLVLALFGLYKSGKNKDFVNIYIDFLSRGGSESPKELVARFGFDIESKDFWKIGIGEIKKMLEEFERIYNERIK